MTERRSFLILWQTAEAESWVGKTPGGTVGTHAKGLAKGDRVFVSACDDKELFLLGAMKISRLTVESRGPLRGKPLAVGETLAGSFQMLPLGALKWRIRFENTEFPRLSTSKSLLWQVRSRRRLAPASAEFLMSTLTRQQALRYRVKREFAREGGLVTRTGTIRERDPRIRAAALKAFAFTCTICGVKPEDFYGRFAKECLDVHHLRPLRLGGAKRSPTTLRDVILVCPTCHRALHMFEDPGEWRRFRRECGF
jgi:hypothetical protein